MDRIRNEDTKLEQRKIHLLKKPKVGLHRTFQPGQTPNLLFYRLIYLRRFNSSHNFANVAIRFVISW